MRLVSQYVAGATKILSVACFVGLALAGCRHLDPGTRVAGWTLLEPAERHPIMVSQEPNTLSLHVSGDSYGLSPRQRSRLVAFYREFRARDAGNSRLVISAPTGSSNETAVMNAVQDVRHVLAHAGFGDPNMIVEGYYADAHTEPPLRISYMSYVAEAPTCGFWPTNLSDQRDNDNYADFGCSQQRNLASHVANPGDLLGPRTMTQRSQHRRDAVWNKYTGGEVTGAEKAEEERVDTEQQ